MQTLILGGQLSDLAAQLLSLIFILLQLLLYFIQETVHLFGPVAADVLFKLCSTHILRGQHSGFLPFHSILKKLDD